MAMSPRLRRNPGLHSAGVVLPLRRAWMLAAASGVLGVIAGLVAYWGNDPGDLAAAILRGASVLAPLAVGLAIWTRLPHAEFGRLLAAAGVLTFLAALGTADNEVLYSIGRVASWFAELAIVYLVLSFPTDRLRDRTDRALAGSFAAMVAVLYLPTALMVTDYPVPSTWTTCVTGCPGNAFEVLTREPAWVGGIVLPLREALTTALLLAVTVRLVSRMLTATTTMRRTIAPVLAGALVHTVGLPIGLGLRRADNASAAVLTVAWVLASGLPVLAVGFLVAAARWRFAIGSGLYRLAPQLHGDMGHEELRAALAEALEDPSVELVYRSSDGRWLDAAGQPVTLPRPDAGRAWTVIADDDSAVAAILHDPALEDQSPFVNAVGGLALVVLVNQRLTAEVEASLQDGRRSRKRILAVADEERRRIERDLHDGAQQRLVALRIQLELASERSTEQQLPNAGELHTFGEEVGEALEAIRSLAAGVYPPLLVDCGLTEALRSVVRGSPTPATIAAQDLGRFSPQIEATVYFCCLEALQNSAKHASARSVSIAVSNGGSDLRFEVRDDGSGFDAERQAAGRGLTNMHDRLVAVGGSLVVESHPGRGTRVAGTIPLTTSG
jgi:signal transduction histidine kinase